MKCMFTSWVLRFQLSSSSHYWEFWQPSTYWPGKWLTIARPGETALPNRRDLKTSPGRCHPRPFGDKPTPRVLTSSVMLTFRKLETVGSDLERNWSTSHEKWKRKEMMRSILEKTNSRKKRNLSNIITDGLKTRECYFERKKERSMFVLLMFSCSVMSDSVTSRTAARQASLSITTPGACSNSCLLSPSPAFSHSQHQGSFLMSRFFASGGQSIETSVSASVLPVNIQFDFL